MLEISIRLYRVMKRFLKLRIENTDWAFVLFGILEIFDLNKHSTRNERKFTILEQSVLEHWP